MQPDPNIVTVVNDALAQQDIRQVVRALRRHADSQGMTSLSKSTGLDRVNLYKILGDRGNPKLDSVMKILETCGLRLEVRPRLSPDAGSGVR